MGREKILINKELSGRNYLPEKYSLDQTVGWFTKTCPVEVDCTVPYKSFVSTNIFNIEKQTSFLMNIFFHNLLVDRKYHLTFRRIIKRVRCKCHAIIQ